VPRRHSRRRGPREITQARTVNHALGLLGTAGSLAEQGRIAEALPLAEAAADIYRRLARADPETYLPDLARTLTYLGTLWSHVCWERAVSPAQEATRIYRHLTRVRVNAMPDVARSLSELLTFLWETAAIARCHTPDRTRAPASSRCTPSS
jgi:hypothetical protein